MKHTEIIKTIMKRNGVLQEELGHNLGLAGSAAVSRRINRKNGTMMGIVDILDALGYEIVIRPAEKSPLAENEYVLHSRDYEGED